MKPENKTLTEINAMEYLIHRLDSADQNSCSFEKYHQMKNMVAYVTSNTSFLKVPTPSYELSKYYGIKEGTEEAIIWGCIENYIDQLKTNL